MTLNARQLFIADSNGLPVTLAGDFTQNPNNIVLAPYFRDVKYIAGEWFHVSRESTGQAFVVFRLGSVEVSPPTLVYPGSVHYVRADSIEIVGVRRAGEIWMTSGDGKAPEYLLGENRALNRNIQARVFPLTQIALYSGGPLSNIWCHPNSAPSSVAPMVCGVSAWPTSAAPLSVVGHTAANWSLFNLCAFSVDPSTQAVYNVRRITSGTATNPVAVGVDINPWDRLGVIAIPSATNPDPSIAPATSFQVLIDCFGVYSRKAEIGYLGMGSGSNLGV